MPLARPSSSSNHQSMGKERGQRASGEQRPVRGKGEGGGMMGRFTKSGECALSAAGSAGAP